MYKCSYTFEKEGDFFVVPFSSLEIGDDSGGGVETQGIIHDDVASGSLNLQNHHATRVTNIWTRPPREKHI